MPFVPLYVLDGSDVQIFVLDSFLEIKKHKKSLYFLKKVLTKDGFAVIIL